MGRARNTARAETHFAALMGPRRGGDGTALKLARAALENGVFGPSFLIIDNDESASENALFDELAIRYAEHSPEITDVDIITPMSEAGILRTSVEGGLLPVGLDEQPFILCDIVIAVRAALTLGAGRRRGSAALQADCEYAVLAEAHKASAAYLQRGGAAHLRSYFGHAHYTLLRNAVASKTGISNKSGALAPLLLRAVTAQWVACVCNHPEDKLHQVKVLTDIATDIYANDHAF